MFPQFVKDLLIDKLVAFLTEEAGFLKDVPQEIEDIEQELVSIQSFVKDADKWAEARGDVSDGVRAWVQELREVAFKIEDIVTEYKHEMAQPQVQQQHSQGWGIQKFLREKTSSIFSLKERHEMASQIKNIKRRLMGIHQRSERYGFKNSIREGSSTAFVSNVPRQTSLCAQEDQLVGIKSARDDLMGRLVDGSSSLTVISVVGDGGSGKTTLARQVYNHAHQRFQCHAWLVVSESCSREELLRTLTRELFLSIQEPLPHDIDTIDEKKLTSSLRQFLQQKRYLVVFDDIWKEDFWTDVQSALVNNRTSARIMITTRKMQVAEFCKRSAFVHTHKMKPLPLKDAWKLFCMKAFKPEGCCPKELEKFSIEIVEKCGRLPLAILVVAGLLYTKDKSVKEWERFHASLSSELESDLELKNVIKILSLSYNDLPQNLKSCFLNFGMFPRNSRIRNGRLIRQWIAERFVKEKERKTPEEVAQEYMNELINRSLVEASDVDVGGKAKTCRVHDLFHEIILKETKNKSFSQVLQGSAESSLHGITRGMSFIRVSSNVLESVKAPHTHSVVVLTEDETLNDVVFVFSTNFKFLKVLDFENAPHLCRLPEDIGNLFDLRYLSVRQTKVKMLPKSIEKLQHLETLDLKLSEVREIPVSIISKLRKLRNLYASNFVLVGIQCDDKLSADRTRVEGGIGCLTDLQKLYCVEAGNHGVDLFRELRNLTQLRTLRISKLRSEDGSALCGCLKQMELLESLVVISTNTNAIIDLESLSTPPQFLKSLKLVGRLSKLPKWIIQLQNLVKIKLWDSKLEDDALQVLENMRNLLELRFSNDAYVGECLQFRAGGFPKLKKLSLRSLGELRSLTIEEAAMPMLETIFIGPCPKMNAVPSGLRGLRNLTSICFHKMPREFRSLNFQTLQHVPYFKFTRVDNEGQDVNILLVEAPNSNVAVEYKIDCEGRYIPAKRARTSWSTFREYQEALQDASFSGTY